MLALIGPRRLKQVLTGCREWQILHTDALPNIGSLKVPGSRDEAVSARVASGIGLRSDFSGNAFANPLNNPPPSNTIGKSSFAIIVEPRFRLSPHCSAPSVPGNRAALL